MTVLIKCICWLIKVTNNNDAWWKPEINNCILGWKLAALVGPTKRVYTFTRQ